MYPPGFCKESPQLQIVMVEIEAMQIVIRNDAELPRLHRILNQFRQFARGDRMNSATEHIMSDNGLFCLP
jgi:hypothetical protein